jgi:hypothetical protein
VGNGDDNSIDRKRLRSFAPSACQVEWEQNKQSISAINAEHINREMRGEGSARYIRCVSDFIVIRVVEKRLKANTMLGVDDIYYAVIVNARFTSSRFGRCRNSCSVTVREEESMPEVQPIYCAFCNYLAILRINDVPHCRVCATKAVRKNSISKVQKQASPLRVVRYENMPIPRVEDLKF